MVVHERGKAERSFVNLRPLTFAAVAFSAGVCFCYGAIYRDLPFFVAFLSLPMAALPLFFSRRKGLAALCFFIFVLFLGLGMGGFALQSERFLKQENFAAEYVVSGEVISVSQNGDYTVMTLKDLTIGEKKTEGRMYVSLRVRAGYTRGDRIVGGLYVTKAGSPYSFHSFRAESVVKDLRYYGSSSVAPETSRKSSDLFGIAERAVRETFYENLPEDSAGLAYALTAGNTDGVEEGILQSVRYGGVAHLFAVSGLHAGAVYLAVRRLFSRLGFSARPRALIALAVVFLFCGVCGFAVSAMRAFFILLVSETARIFRSRADGMELTAFVWLCLSFFSPARIFTVGFLLSLSAYAGATLLSPVFMSRVCARFDERSKKRAIDKIVFSAAKSAVVTVSAEACILPVMLVFFGYTSVWGLILNVLFIPLFSLAFPLLLLSSFLACLFPVASGVLLLPADAVLALFSLFFRVCDFSGVLLCGFVLSAVGVATYYLLLVCLSGRIGYKNYGVSRVPICLLLSALLLFDTVAYGTPAADDCKITHMCYDEGFHAALVECGAEHVLILNGVPPQARMRTFLYRHCPSPTAVVIASESPKYCLNAMSAYSYGDAYAAEGLTDELREHRVITAESFWRGELHFSFSAADELSFEVYGYTFRFGLDDGNTTLFCDEERDGLIFRINNGILSVGTR